MAGKLRSDIYAWESIRQMECFRTVEGSGNAQLQWGFNDSTGNRVAEIHIEQD